MNDDIISQLQQATTDEQKTWVITEVTLKTQPFKGAPPDVTGQVAAHRGSLTQGGDFCGRLRLTP